MRITAASMRETTRTHIRTHAYMLHVHACIGCPGRKRARPRASVTLFSNFPFMGYRLVSICRFVTTPGDLHGQIGLLHAATYPAPLFLLLHILLTAFYITIFRHRARDLPPPSDISHHDNLFFLPFSLYLSFFPLSLFLFIRPPVFPRR